MSEHPERQWIIRGPTPPSLIVRAATSGYWPLILVGLFVVSLLVGYYMMDRHERAHPRRHVQLVKLRLRVRALPIIVERTAYSLEVAQTDADPFTGRCGKIHPRGVPVGDGLYLPAVAVSRDLLKLADCGARVRVNGQVHIVWDTMAEHWRRRVDVLAMSRGEANQLGKRRVTFEVVRR